MLFNPKKPWLFFDKDGASGGGGGGGQETDNEDLDTGGESDDTDPEDTEDLELDGEFDEDRAKATILSQRKAERKLQEDLKAKNAALKEYQDAEQARKDAELSDLDKANKSVETLTSQVEQLQGQVKDYQLKEAFSLMAGELELNFASLQAAADAYDLLDLDGVDIEGGKVTGLKDKVKALSETRPYLFSENGNEEKPAYGTPQRKKVPQTKTGSENQTEANPSAVKL